MTIAAAVQSETVKEEGGGVKRTCDLLVPLLSVSLCTKTVEEGGRVQECMNLEEREYSSKNGSSKGGSISSGILFSR